MYKGQESYERSVDSRTYMLYITSVDLPMIFSPYTLTIIAASKEIELV